MRWPYFIGYNYDILGTFGQNVLWDSSFKAKAIFVLLCISPICLHAILLGFVKYCFEKRSGKINWKKVVNFSTLGLLGNFSDSSKILSVTRNIVQNRFITFKIVVSVIMALSNSAILFAGVQILAKVVFAAKKNANLDPCL